MGTLAFIHTAAGLAGRFRQLARAELGDWSSYAVVDESLLLDTIERGTVSPRTKQRLTGYVFAAADAGADAVVVTCSTLGGVVDAIRPLSPAHRRSGHPADAAGTHRITAEDGGRRGGRGLRNHVKAVRRRLCPASGGGQACA